jgi:hypothetical protein
MEHVNNDMDDLFHKAGDLYPLKTSESDWNDVLGKLKAKAAGDQSTVPGFVSGKRIKRRWSLLLLLIPIGLGSAIYFTATKKQPRAVTAIASENSNTPNNKPKISEEKLKTEDNKNISGGIPSEKNGSQVTTGSARISKKSFTYQKIFVHSGQKETGSKTMDQNTTAYEAAAAGHPLNHESQGGIIPQSSDKDNIQRSSNKNDAAVLTIPESGNGTREAAGSVSAASTQMAVNEQTKEKPVSVDSSKTKSAAPAKISPAVKSSKGFYAGLLVGPDFSSVKLQSVKQTGYSLGISVGYRFNRRIAVETGVLWDKKYYYSSGEYFKKSPETIPEYQDILELNGNCNMIEIPLNFRYDFAFGRNHSFFAKAGLSSYFMTKENYSYQVEQNSSPPWWKNGSYNNSSNNIFSILQISGGYELAVSGNTKISIEPYVKIPIQGVGIGSMPISSAGFYFGISHYFR